MSEAGAATSTNGAGALLKDQGNEFFKAGNYLKAAATYTQAIKLEPNNSTLYRYAATRFHSPSREILLSF
jgi:Flp pilus assembly protein TadD